MGRRERDRRGARFIPSNAPNPAPSIAAAQRSTMMQHTAVSVVLAARARHTWQATACSCRGESAVASSTSKNLPLPTASKTTDRASHPPPALARPCAWCSLRHANATAGFRRAR